MRIAPLAAVTLALLATSSPALAYVRAKTCDPLGLIGRPCASDESSFQLYWPNNCVTYYFQRDGSDDFPRASRQDPSEELILETLASFDAWSDPECSSLRLVYGGVTCNQEVGYANSRVSGGGMNVVMWREVEWEHSFAAFGLTTTTSNPETGEILDADIELNGVHYTFGVVQDPSDLVVDVRNTLTHEVGHLVGFDHEMTVGEATMSPDADLGDIDKRDLHSDDIEGLCDTYPSIGEKPLCSTPPALSDDSCTIALEGQVTCSSAPTPRRPDAPWWALLALAPLGLGHASRRLRRRLTR